MKGNNTLILNSATMIDALQDYLNAKMSAPVVVKSVKMHNGNTVYASAGDQFSVEVEENKG